MKTTWLFLGGLLVAATVASGARANHYPYYPPQRPQAPDACGPGGWCTNQYGMMYGPNYWLRPAFPPHTPLGGGMPQMNRPQITFPTHPFARSPRDFFMVD